MRVLALASPVKFLFDALVRWRDRGEDLAGSDDKKTHRGKPASRWNVQPLRELSGDVYPTPPTESLRKGQQTNRPTQKTRRRRPPRPSKS